MVERTQRTNKVRDSAIKQLEKRRAVLLLRTSNLEDELREVHYLLTQLREGTTDGRES